MRLCGGCAAGTNSVRSRRQRSIASTAMRRWALWMGSNAPPKMASLNACFLGFFDRYRPYLHVLGGPVLRAFGEFGDFLDYVVALHHFAEDDVLVVEPGCLRNRDEELAAV